MTSLIKALRAQMLTSVAGACICMCVYQGDRCSLPGEDHIPTIDDIKPVSSNTPLRRKQSRSKWVTVYRLAFLYLSPEKNLQLVELLNYPTHSELSGAVVPTFWLYILMKKTFLTHPQIHKFIYLPFMYALAYWHYI